MSFELKPDGFLVTWPAAAENKTWGLLHGGYFAMASRGVKFLQRFVEWGVASVGQQREMILRFELTLRKVTTSGFLHIELLNPAEARLWIINVAVWKGWNLFFIVNFGVRLTSASQTVRAQRMRQIMEDEAKREQARRIHARRIAGRVHQQSVGHPWPPVHTK